MSDHKPQQPEHKQESGLQIDDELKQTNDEPKPELSEDKLALAQDKNNHEEVGEDKKQGEKDTAHEIKGDLGQTVTRAEMTLTQNRDPVHPETTKSKQKHSQSSEKKEEEKPVPAVQATQSKKQPLPFHPLNSPKKQQPLTKPSAQSQPQPQPEQPRKTSSSSQVKLDDLTSIALQRPISININKDTLQMMEKVELTLKEPDVKIEINQTVEKGFALNKQVYFRVTGFDRHGGIDVLRKLQEFQSLRKILLERWPGCFVPMISQRSDTRTEELRGLHRRKNLENFLKKLSYSEEIYYKEEVQLFLRSYGIDMQEMFLQMPVLRVRDVIERFKGCFGQIVEKPNLPQNLSSIKRFSTSLKKIANNLNNLAKRILKLAESYQTYQQAMPNFAKFLNSYEQTCLSEYTNNPDKAIALRDSEGKLTKLRAIQDKPNIFYDLYFLFECQNRDAQALSQVILAMQMFNIRRDDLQTSSKQTRQQIDQISLGHSNLKLMTSRKTREEVQLELQTKQKQLIEEKHIILQLAGMSQIMLAQVTIPLFKKMKINNYFNLIKKWVQTVGELHGEIYGVWKFVEEESRACLKKYGAEGQGKGMEWK